ncbi:type 1 glutamine amidotransferase [Macrococcoides bohemicum]|uniref:type 1 glutamine amidotransferase n=1 Tax=Macrococcoides bohemicum TaxID=1903056 RepID=UPI00105AAD99|nr:type 1 glutamine amidotransferase [Macrococcus bohemicus]TDL38281.1 type 1 glutamine amidotransferase [Macrococcus bohemicus]
MNIYILQHVPFENPGILEALNAKVINLYENNHILPDEKDIDMLIVLGGPMNVHDDIPWLNHEKELIKDLIKNNKPLLGICLGAQLIAEVLGGEVYPNSKGKEVGFGVIKKQTNDYSFLPQQLDVLHWHGDTFTLPDKAKRLYSSAHCENQAFIYNENVIGLQFHMETTKETLSELVEADREYITGNVLNNTEEDIMKYDIPAENQEVLLSMVDYISGGCINGK